MIIIIKVIKLLKIKTNKILYFIRKRERYTFGEKGNSPIHYLAEKGKAYFWRKRVALTL